MATARLFEQGAEAIRLSTDPGTRADRFYQQQGWERGDPNKIEEMSSGLKKPEFTQ